MEHTRPNKAQADPKEEWGELVEQGAPLRRRKSELGAGGGGRAGGIPGRPYDPGRHFNGAAQEGLGLGRPPRPGLGAPEACERTERMGHI